MQLLEYMEQLIIDLFHPTVKSKLKIINESTS